MRDVSPDDSKRGIFTGAGAADAAKAFFADIAHAGHAAPGQASKQGGSSMGMLEDKAISGFSFKASEDLLADLHRRVAMTRWRERETVADATHGVAQAVIDVAKI